MKFDYTRVGTGCFTSNRLLYCLVYPVNIPKPYPWGGRFEICPSISARGHFMNKHSCAKLISEIGLLHTGQNGPGLITGEHRQECQTGTLG
jgi:hypothetical protein